MICHCFNIRIVSHFPSNICCHAREEAVHAGPKCQCFSDRRTHAMSVGLRLSFNLFPNSNSWPWICSIYVPNPDGLAAQVEWKWTVSFPLFYTHLVHTSASLSMKCSHWWASSRKKLFTEDTVFWYVNHVSHFSKLPETCDKENVRHPSYYLWIQFQIDLGDGYVKNKSLVK